MLHLALRDFDGSYGLIVRYYTSGKRRTYGFKVTFLPREIRLYIDACINVREGGCPTLLISLGVFSGGLGHV